MNISRQMSGASLHCIEMDKIYAIQLALFSLSWKIYAKRGKEALLHCDSHLLRKRNVESVKANWCGAAFQHRKREIRPAGSFNSAHSGADSDQTLGSQQLATVHKFVHARSAAKNDVAVLHEGRINRNLRTVLYNYKLMITPEVLPC